MALDIVFKVVSKIADCSVPTIRAQIGYVISYESNVEKLQIELQKLEGAKDTVQHSVDDAKQNGKEIFDHVKKWLEKVDGVVAQAKRFVDNEEHARVGCIGGSIPIPWTRHQLSIKAEKIAKEISEILTQAKFNDNEISYLPSVPVAFPPSARGYETLNSRTLILKELMQALKDANIYKVGVYGMGGVGKSSLIKELAWQAERDGSFGKVIVATVTNSPDLKRIQGQLGDGLGLNFKEETEEGRARRLWDRIRKESNILVIMDDIWKKLDLTEVGIPFGDAHRGCNLLFTSRYLNVLRKDMGTEKNFRLETLLEEESWNLFEKAAGDVVNDISLQPTAIKVARSCKGLPVLIVTVAKALKDQDLYAWKDALLQLTKYEDEGLASVANEAIELSYKYLASNELKSLFLLIASAGSGNFHIEYLRTYGWCLDLFKNVKRLADARNRLYKLIDDLMASCLLLEGDREWVRMHDVIREVAVRIASKVQTAFHKSRFTELKEWPDMDQLKNCKHIFIPWCYNMPELPTCLKCPKLETLELCCGGNFSKVPDQFFSDMRDLKVLDLGGMTCIPSLPQSLQLLKNLRALYLYKCMLEDITIVSELTGLEILSLEMSEIQELPKEIRQLTRLQMLNLGNCYKLRRIPANLISSLRRLEELYMGNCYIQWEIEGSNQSNNASLGELRHLHLLKSLELQVQDISFMPRDLLIFEKLERYKILIGSGWKWSWDVSGYFETSRTLLKLELGSATITHLDRGVKMLLNGVEDLYLAKLNGVQNILSKLNEEGFPILKNLHIQNSAEIAYIIDFIEWVQPYRAFPDLKSMVICNLINLEQICYGPLPIPVFTKLQVIKVSGCNRLQNLFSFSMVRNLHQLVEIEISECKSMTNIVEQGREDFEDNAQLNFPKIQSFKLEGLPKLTSFYSKQWTTNITSKDSATEYKDNLFNPLALFDKVVMPNLESMKVSSINTAKLWDDVSASSCIQNLTCLTIDNCGSLTYLFSAEVGRVLVKLQYLEIANCQMMEEIFVLEGKLGNLSSASNSLSHEQVTFPNLETLVISHMDNLKSIWNNGLAPYPFPKMTKMEVSFCQKLLHVIPFDELKNLHNLETLCVTDCVALEVLFEMQGLKKEATDQDKVDTQFRTLTLKHLPMLKFIWSNDPCGRLQCQNLCSMKATHCQSLNHVFPLSVAMELRKLQMLDIRSCGVESIVAMGETPKEVPSFVFPQLTSLTFWRLKKLRSFYPGIHILDCPVIKKIDVYHCSNLKVFRSNSQKCHQEVVTYHEQPLFLSEKVIPYVEDLSLSSNDVINFCNGEYRDDKFYTIKALSLQCFHNKSDEFPMDFLQRFTNLENLTVGCSSFIEIFLSENIGRIVMLKTLTLNGLNKLEYLYKDKPEMQPVLRNLETLELLWCSGLKNIAPSTSSLLFQNLDKLWVGYCSGLVNLITPSLARSLPKLRNLWIYNCDMIEEIVASETDAVGEIALMKLEHLQLENLPRLTSFCNGNWSFKFPLLKTLYVMECPKMETFSHGNLSTPNLKQVRVTPTEDGEWHWQSDLNTTIRKIFSEKESDED